MSGVTFACAAATPAASSAPTRSANERGLAIAQRIACHDQLDIVRHRFVDCARERAAIIGEHQAGREQIDDRRAACRSRSTSTNRPPRSAHRECRHTSLRDASNACSMSLPDSTTIGLSAKVRAAAAPRRSASRWTSDLRISELAPFALCIALCQEQTVWRDLRPMFERLAELVVIRRRALARPGYG